MSMPRHVLNSVLVNLESESRSQYCQKFLAHARFLAGQPELRTATRKSRNSRLRSTPSLYEMDEMLSLNLC